MDADNVMVVVSRWYGGINLGPDRFKHINNVARILLLSSKLVSHILKSFGDFVIYGLFVYVLKVEKKDNAVKGKSKQKRKH